MLLPRFKIVDIMRWTFVVGVALSFSRYATNLETIVAFAGLLLFIRLMPFVTGPIKLHRSQWLALQPEYRLFDPSEPAAPSEVRDHFGREAEQLAALGFTLRQSYQLPNSTAGAVAFVALYQNKQTLESAKLISTLTQSGRVSALANFTTEFADGTEVNTSNRSTPQVLPPFPPPIYNAVFPQIRHTGQLLMVHRARVKRFDDGRIRTNPDATNLDDHLASGHRRASAHRLKHGYYYVDAVAGVQRLTWKGALLSAWKLTPPIKQFRLDRERAEAARLLQQLGTERRNDSTWYDS